MDLQETIEVIRTLEKELVLFNIEAADPIDEQLETFFETHKVNITTYRTPSGKPTEIAVLSTADDLLEIIDIDTLRNLVAHSQTESDTIGIADGEYEQILGHLKETTFTSVDNEQMLYTSREIEDRARRVGRGTIHTGFQRCSVIADQLEIYTDLVRQGLDVHAYGIPDTDPPMLDGGQVHTPETDEIARTWFVVYDGGGDATQKTALLAEEKAPDSFYGVWTYDPRIVDSVLTYLERTYTSPNDKSVNSEM
jgi:DICT domain-containing protein